MRVALYGPYGWGNLGDAAIQESMLANVRRRRPDARFVGISLNPTNTTAIHGIEALPITRHWSPPPVDRVPDSPAAAPAPEAAPHGAGWRDAMPVRLLRALLRPVRPFVEELRFCLGNLRHLQEIDLLVISGGGQISDDWGGPMDHPWSMFTWALCARIAGTPVAIVSVGAGPIDAAWSRRFFLMALRLASWRSVRDEESLQYLRRSGCTLPVEVYPDLAFGLPAPAPTGSGPEHPVVGISPMAWCHPDPGLWPEQDGARYERLMELLTRFTRETVDRGHAVRLFTNQIRNDRRAFDDLVARAALDETPATRDLDHLLERIAGADLVVTSRLHGVILSFLQGKPVIALSYESKIDAVMRQFGQWHFRLDIEEFTGEELRSRCDEILQLREELSARIAAVAARHRQKLDEQYDRLFGEAPA